MQGVQFHSYIVHRKESFPLALQCHGLDPTFLASKPPPSLVIPAFVKFVNGAVLVGHNVAFDLRMLNAELQRLNMPPVPGISQPSSWYMHGLVRNCAIVSLCELRCDVTGTLNAAPLVAQVQR